MVPDRAPEFPEPAPQTPLRTPGGPAVLPAPPAYGERSIAEVFTSAAASLGVPGFANRLNLPAAKHVCVVLADGLGRQLLKQKSAHTPFLRSVLQAGQGAVPVWLDAAFPSTTAASLASFGTGLPAGQHGMVGYDVLDPDQDRVVNMLNGWDPGVDPQLWQPMPTVFERAAGHVDVSTVALPRFSDSAMTRAALRGGRFLPGTTSHARTAAAAEARVPVGLSGSVTMTRRTRRPAARAADTVRASCSASGTPAEPGTKCATRPARLACAA